MVRVAAGVPAVAAAVAVAEMHTHRLATHQHKGDLYSFWNT